MSGWVRLWSDMPTDPKFRVIARRSGQPLSAVLAVFMMLLLAARDANDGGNIPDMDHEDIAAALDLDPADVSAICSAMQGKVLHENTLTGWDKRQPKREDSTVARRVSDWREKKKRDAEECVTHGNASVTRSNAPESESESESDNPPNPPLGEWVCPEYASPEVWRDFLAARKRKRLVNTESTWRQFLADIARHTCPGWPPGKLIEHAAAKGWGAIYRPDADKPPGKARNLDAVTMPPEPAPVAAKARENEQSRAIHAALHRDMGGALYDTWIADTALIADASGLTVIAGSAFKLDWIEGHYRKKIERASRASLGLDAGPVRFECA